MTQSRTPLQTLSPAALRARIRRGEWTGPTAGLAPGYTQANLVVLPQDVAEEFAEFCRRNPKPCPVLAQLPPGDPRVPDWLARDADIRTDIPRYRVYRNGRLVDEPTDLLALWQPDFVAFLLGCSFSFDGALQAAGLTVRHVEQGRNVPMFRTHIPTVPAGRFHGPLVVTYRPVPPQELDAVLVISARYPLAHGAPVHVGDPAAIGIHDLSQPDWGDPVEAAPDDVPVFWACGVTPQAVALACGVALMITHAPGHMFVADLPIRALEGRPVQPEAKASGG